MRRLLVCIALAACGPPARVPTPPTVVSATACSADFVRPGDRVETWETPSGLVGADVLREGVIVGWGRARSPASTIRVREAGRFTKVCGRMVEVRAGHAAAKLASGSVFLSGGFQELGGRVALAGTELFDPATETFDAGPPLRLQGGAELARAHHSSTTLPTGQVLLHRGERYGAGATTSTSSSLIFDAEKGGYGALPPRQAPAPQNITRSRHIAVEVPGGVLIAGGVTGSMLSPALDVEVFETATNRLVFVGALAAAPTAGAWVQSRNRAALVSGTAIDLVAPSLGVTREQAALSTSRAAAWAFASGDEVLVVGEGTSEIVNLATHTVTPGPAVPSAADGCAVGLGEARWLFVSGTSATLVSRDGWTVTPMQGLPALRTNATCTLLDDGTVLVAGGEGPLGLQDDAWIFTPPL